MSDQQSTAVRFLCRECRRVLRVVLSPWLDYPTTDARCPECGTPQRLPNSVLIMQRDLAEARIRELGVRS